MAAKIPTIGPQHPTTLAGCAFSERICATGILDFLLLKYARRRRTPGESNHPSGIFVRQAMSSQSTRLTPARQNLRWCLRRCAALDYRINVCDDDWPRWEIICGLERARGKS